MTNWKKYIFWFAQEHLDFRKPEILSLLELYSIPMKYIEVPVDKQPYWLVELPNEDAAKKIASRSLSIRCIIDLWAHGQTHSQFHTNLKFYLDENNKKLTHFFQPDTSFRITVETYNKHLKQAEKIEKIEQLDYLPTKGRVNLKKPDIEWWYIEYYGMDPNNVPEQPFSLIFGKWVINGRRALIKEMSLKTRKFIGNTSMDAQLSLLMANQALVKTGDFVFDPFVGTGSLLAAAAKFGGFVMGTDIDFLMLHGRTRPTRVTQQIRDRDESIRTNLRQYGVENLYIDVLVSDFSLSIWNDQLTFDSIITDPPYGIREATEKIESKKYATPDLELIERDRSLTPPPHFPSTSHYNLSTLFSDLLNFAARRLRMGGRLICWIPIFRPDYSEEHLPGHTCLQLVANSEQDISAITSRRLLTYEKVKEFSGLEIQENEQVIDAIGEFRQKFFEFGEETRQQRRIKRAERREVGKMEALKRGKTLNGNGEDSQSKDSR